MTNRKGLLILVALLLVVGFGHARSDPDYKTIEVGGLTRRYIVVSPAIPHSAQLPVLFALHGGGGNARGFSGSGFSRLAGERGYLVVYPEGLERSWNDGHTRPVNRNKTNRPDDVAFLDALLDQLKQDYPIDANRVFAAGVSNGALMAHSWANASSESLAGIAPIAGGISEALAQEFHPRDPVSVLVIQGTADPLIPYQGGQVKILGHSTPPGLSTERCVELWTRHNDCGAVTITELPDTIRDGCRVEWISYAPGKGGAQVVLCKVIGGGHTIPSGRQYLPERVIGPVCRDIDAFDLIGEFFDKHPKSSKCQIPSRNRESVCSGGVVGEQSLFALHNNLGLRGTHNLVSVTPGVGL